MEKRTHIVLVPGFGGFDALGQLQYYFGVTGVFGTWRPATGDRARAVLHYFDNLPTAAVTTRAKKLRLYIQKLIDRHVIQAADEIVLVGHSTGGLDIRQLVLDLAGARETTILARLQRLVFLSVPQRGTNIADWVGAHRGTIRVLVSLMRRAVGLHVPLALGPARFLLRRLEVGDPQMFEAVEDTRREIDLPSDAEPLALADARRSSAEVDLWLAHTDGDFLAIDDLASARAGGARPVDDGEPERAIWRTHGITTRSYATVGRCPFDRDTMGARSGELRSLPDLFGAARDRTTGTDLVYRLAYAACAGGRFTAPRCTSRWLAGCAPTGAGATHTPADWENDGIVNTASMQWPDGANTLLVSGDHADIIGHFELAPWPTPAGRRYAAYDLLGSGSTFTRPMFEAVWRDVFDFAVP